MLLRFCVSLCLLNLASLYCLLWPYSTDSVFNVAAADGQWQFQVYTGLKTLSLTKENVSL